MPEVELSEAAEELLANLWVMREEGNAACLPLSELETEDRDAAVPELLTAGLAQQESDMLSLTSTGEREASVVVRRERLAERLLVDVLDLRESVATEAACKFEHLLRTGIDDEICTLLGHPKVCPHGSPIPPGECCHAGAREAGKAVSALSDLVPGQGGVIAYLHSGRRQMMQRMLAMGAIPGARIVLVQKFPSYVFRMGERQIAVDRETAQDIYVRLTGGQPVRPPSWFPRPFRGWGRRFRRGRRGQ